MNLGIDFSWQYIDIAIIQCCSNFRKYVRWKTIATTKACANLMAFCLLSFSSDHWWDHLCAADNSAPGDVRGLSTAQEGRGQLRLGREHEEEVEKHRLHEAASPERVFRLIFFPSPECLKIGFVHPSVVRIQCETELSDWICSQLV